VRNLAAIKAKANAKFTCQECGSTERAQAHHERPGDDSSLICICAECHSAKHPDIPKALFFNKNQQPYWHNKSASSLARELRVHPRTVVRAAKHLGIAGGELTRQDEARLRTILPRAAKPKREEERKPRPIRVCPRCNYSWQGITFMRPSIGSVCPRCANYFFLDNPKASQSKYSSQPPLFPRMTPHRLSPYRYRTKHTAKHPKTLAVK